MIKHDHGFPTVCVFTHTIMRLIHTIEKPFYRQIENENLHQISCQRIIQILQLDICIKKFQKKKSTSTANNQKKNGWISFKTYFDLFLLIQVIFRCSIILTRFSAVIFKNIKHALRLPKACTSDFFSGSQ